MSVTGVPAANACYYIKQLVGGRHRRPAAGRTALASHGSMIWS